MEISSQRFTLPLCQADCQQAESRAAAQRDPEIAHQVQYNTLAVLATRYYLRLLGIASEPLEASESPELSADLVISPAQRLRCLPVIAGKPLFNNALTLNSSGEQLKYCLGTLAVQVDMPRREVQILGLLPSAQSATTSALSFRANQMSWASHGKLPPLQPAAILINRLSESPITHLQQWLIGQFEAGWRHLFQALLPQPPSPCFRTSQQEAEQPIVLSEEALLNIIRHSADDEQRWQAAEQLWVLNPAHLESPVLCAKDLGLYLLGHSVTLLVGILAKPNQQRLILIRLLPAGKKPYLPDGLTLTGQDSAGGTVFSIQSRQQDDYIQFKFTADAGDHLDVCVSWGTASVTEHFIV